MVRIGTTDVQTPAPSSAELRVWARANGWTVSDRGRLPAELVQAWRVSQVSVE